ncbi:MAG: hypothetical protein Q8K57_11565 [Thiobacillus sp.]|nr:hypothetical protein [Gammaproteobacteria bacterium]MDO9009058.1 hypothetical protein [Thiobacillus sp.]MDP1925406.1 hypothetical protein [Thiobacillus sp.]MDP3126023.1 hypothetical protein [Thiobacillus sp.]
MFGFRKAMVSVIVSFGFSYSSVADIPRTSGEVQKLNTEKQIPRCLEDYRGISNRPQRVFVGINSIIRDPGFARYAKRWAELLQGELDSDLGLMKATSNVGQELRLTVETFPRGQVGSVEIDKSSGSNVFDGSMTALVNRVAARAPFPQEVCMKVDIVHLTIGIENTVNGLRVLQPK